MADKLDLIIDKIDNVHEDLKSHKEESNKRFDVYNQELTEHKEGVIQNRGRIEAIENIKEELVNSRKSTFERLEKLEKPHKFLYTLGNIIKYSASIAGGMYIILKLLKEV